MDETTALKKFDSIAHKMANFYFARSGNKYEYDDLYQAARIGIVNAVRTYNPADAKLITYAWICAKNEVKKHMRNDTGLIRVPAAADESVKVTVIDSAAAQIHLEFMAADDDIVSAIDSVVLAEALAKIPENQRNAVTCVILQSMTYEDAASELGVSKQYVHQLTQKGLDSLRKIMIDEVPQMS